MPKLILLGTGAALSDAHRENTFMVVQGESSSILVDCGGGPTQHLLRAGVPLDSVDHIVLTHHHPDHLYGLSVFLMDLWLAGRDKPLQIHGLRETLRAARTMMKAFEWERWRPHGFYPVEFRRVPPRINEPVLSTPEFSVLAAPTKHLLPTIAVRFSSRESGRSATYSSDTMVCESIVELACGSDLLFHEATTLNRALEGHSSAVQAGAQARRAGVKKLVLVHLPPDADVEAFRAAARARFGGPVVVARDLMQFSF